MARSVKLTLTMPAATRDRLGAIAAADHIGMSEAVRRLVDREHGLRIMGLVPIASRTGQPVAQLAPE